MTRRIFFRQLTTNLATAVGGVTAATWTQNSVIGATLPPDSDATRPQSDAFKGELSSPLGGDMVGFRQAAPAAVLRTALAKMSETVSVKDFGAKGDGTTDDTAAIQAAFNTAAGSGGRHPTQMIFFPTGTYLISSPLKIPTYAKISGAGMLSTTIKATTTFVGGIFENNESNFHYRVTLQDLTIDGGQYGYYINLKSGDQANCYYNNVAFKHASIAQFYSNRTLQTTNFTNCIFDGGGKPDSKGIVADSFVNMNNFSHCQFVNLGWTDVQFTHSAEVNNFSGCRFEGGGTHGRETLSLNNSRATNFLGCYFENTHSTLLRESSSKNGVTFNDCHFTYGYDGTASVPYVFVSDGVVNFGNNHWYKKASLGPPRMSLVGNNGSELGGNDSEFFINSQSKRHKHYLSKTTQLSSSAAVDLLRFSRTEQPTSATDSLQMLTGLLTVNYLAYTTEGLDIMFSRIYHVTVTAIGRGAMVSRIAQASENSNPRGNTMTVSQKSEATALALTLSCATTQTSANTRASMVQCAFEYFSSAAKNESYITVA